QTTRFLLDTRVALAQVILEYTPGGVIKASYTFGNKLISQLAGGQRLYYGYDGHSGVRLMTNSAHAVVATNTYDAFGRMLASTGPSGNSFLYRGEQRDMLSGLSYLRARYYDPNLGRFLSRDTL